MAVIKSGSSTDQLTIDATSKAARVTLYDSAGNEKTNVPVSGSVSVSNFPATQTVNGSVSVSNFPATQNVAITSSVEVEVKNDTGNPLPVSGTFFQATQPVSIASSVPVTGPLTDTQLRASAVPISNTNLDVALSTRLKPADTLTAVTTVGTITNPVSISNFPATQPISAASLPLPSGAATSALQTQPGVDIGDVTINNAGNGSAVNIQDGGNSITVDGSISVSNFPATQPVSGTISANQSGTWTVQPGNTANTTAWKVDGSAVTQPVSGTFFQATQPISASALPLPSGASTSANQTLQMQDATFTGRINTQGQKTMSASTPVVLASDQSTIITSTFVKATYRAATATANNGVVVAAASTAPFFAFYGSATKTITVQRMFISGSTLTAVTYLSYVLAKYSTAVTGGTAVALTQVPLNAASAAGTASICNVYTAAPTAGTLIGPISTKRTLAQSTTAAAAGSPDIVEFDFRTSGSPVSGIVLSGTAQGIALNFGATPATAVTLAIAVEWTEE